ncbi:MAG: hypothetical protein JRI72_00605 [Deltaproteobacteria bacterium]|nr:hypothetical protein [Deltaproteobacteria bacterium]
MKRLILTLLFIFCLSFQSSAWNPMIVGSGSQVGSNRPSYYASAILSMNFEDGLDAYDSSGNAVTFTDSGSDIGAYGDGGGQAMKCDDASEDITLTQTAGQYFDETAKQTICMKVYVSATVDTNTRIFQAFDVEDDDGTIVSIMSGGSISGDRFVESGADVGASSYTYSTGSWIIIGYSYEGDTTPNGDHSANSGDTSPWANGWEDDADEIDDSMTDRPVDISIGSMQDPGDTEIIYIDEWAIFSGYKCNCSDYMN